MSEHTPGPWHISGTHPRNIHIGAASSPMVLASMNENHTHTPANAKVMAAAPHLLSALEDLVEMTEVPDPNCSCHVAPPCGDCVDYGGIREALANARAVIAKATI